MMNIGLLMSDNDNVAVVTSPVKKGDPVMIGGREYTAKQDIPAGHKIAVYDIRKGEDILKYGKLIGRASEDIKTGQWVHCHNVDEITEEISRAYAENYRRSAMLGK